jgi:CHAT domain-containing protein/Tfp pilus assembly protein PilF
VAVQGCPPADFNLSLALFLLFSLFTVAPSRQAFGRILGPLPQSDQHQRDASDEKDDQLLEQGKQIERELAGSQTPIYRIELSAGQFLKVIVKQDGIDVVVQVSGLDGKQILEFDSESRLQGEESVSLVAEATGIYVLRVRPRYRRAATGSYQVRIEELRTATENDRALQEARKLFDESRKLGRLGQYGEALPFIERAVEIRERILGADHQDVAAALNVLAALHHDRGGYSTAESLHQRALAIWEKALGPNHPNVAVSLEHLGNIHTDRGEYAKAEPMHQRALTIREKALGPDHPNVANSLNNLAILYQGKGDYARGESLYQRALTIREKAFGPDHTDVAQALSNLAYLYVDIGEYEKAEPFYQRAQAIWEKAHGSEHPIVAYPINGLAHLYHRKGDYVKAEPLYGRALAILEKALGPDHPNVAALLNNLALIYEKKGEHEKADQLYQRALAIREKALGPDHLDVAQSLDNLAVFYGERGEYAKAEPLQQRGLAIREKALGPDHPVVAQSLNNLAILYKYRDEYEKAEPLYRRALAISEKALGPEHSQVRVLLSNLAVLHAAKGDIAQAITDQSLANAAGERNLALHLAIGSERQKLAYLALFSTQTEFTLSLHSQAAPNDPRALDLAITTLLRRKGRGLDAMADTIAKLRRSASPEDRVLFDRLAEARARLAALTLRESDVAKPDIYQEQLKQFEEEVEKREADLSVRSAAFRAQTQLVTLAAIQAALPADSALIEFAIYTPRELKTGGRKPPRYLVYMLTAHGPPKWADLGEAAVIDRAVDAWRTALRNPKRADVKRLARGVDEKVMQPVRSILGGMSGETRRLLISPDGSLNLIPFAALVDEQNRYLVKRYTINYLTSGRDLLRLHTSEPSKSAPFIIASPLFGRVEIANTRTVQNSGNLQAGDQGQVEIDQREISFLPLPGARREALAIKARLPDALMLLGEDATETALKEAKAPRILHIATHSFFLGDQGSPRAEWRGFYDGNLSRISDLRLDRWAAKIENPLLRSGLALAGINQHRVGDDDGALTAMEAAGLDLWGTRLVVLSGCDTGVGEVKNGEGVYGLRRALVLAGSETQVLSLWPVLDNMASGLMAGYYQRLLKGEGRGEALRQIQLGMLKDAKLRHPYYWANFIQAGEWANLDGQR